MKFATVLILSLIMIVNSAPTALYGVEWINGYNNATNEIDYSKVDTIEIDPKTGEVTSLLTNLVHASGNYFILYGLNSVNSKTNELYYAFNIGVGSDQPSMQPVYGVDLNGKKLLPPIIFDIILISSVNYDHGNDRLLVSGFDSLTPNVNDSSILLSYDFKTHKTERLYTFQGFVMVSNEYLDADTQQLFFIATLSNQEFRFGVLDLNTLKPPKLIDPQACPIGALVGTLRFDSKIGLYAIGLSVEPDTHQTSFHFLQFTSNGDCTHHLLMESDILVFSSFTYDPTSQNVYLIYQSTENVSIMTYNVGSQKLTNNVPLSRRTIVTELVSVQLK